MAKKSGDSISKPVSSSSYGLSSNSIGGKRNGDSVNFLCLSFCKSNCSSNCSSNCGAKCASACESLCATQCSSLCYGTGADAIRSKKQIRSVEEIIL